MDDREVGKYWDGNAAAWTALSRAGYDVCRDAFNTPAFLTFLPEVAGLRGLDVGCGEGHNTRLVAARGARMTAFDLAPSFVTSAAGMGSGPPAVHYAVASALALPFGDATFDFAVSFMCLMDCCDKDQALREAARVLTPGGFFQFSIIHPCFNTPVREWVRDENGAKVGLAVRDYFRETDGDVEEWIFNSAPEECKNRYPKFKIPFFHRPLSSWLNAIAAAGFSLEAAQEPVPDAAALARRPDLYDAAIAPFYIHFRCRKPAGDQP